MNVDIITFQNPLQKLRIFTFWLFLGGHFDEKIQKNHFFKGCGEKMAITRLKIGLAPSKLLSFDREQNFV